MLFGPVLHDQQATVCRHLLCLVCQLLPCYTLCYYWICRQKPFQMYLTAQGLGTPGRSLVGGGGRLGAPPVKYSTYRADSGAKPLDCAERVPLYFPMPHTLDAARENQSG